MRHIQVNAQSGFHVIAQTKRSQAATMAISPGDKEGGPDNKHDADQWLYVIDGTGQATVEGITVDLSEGDLLEIPAGEKHEIRNTGRTVLKTLNIYAPPEF
jgi:mannose-6-phosphate isomerase-like protein (cupin superfamily)